MITFAELMRRLCPGCSLEYSKSPLTWLTFEAPVVVGGEFSFDCGVSAPIPWIIEPLIILLSFAQQDAQLTLHGITNCDTSSIDTLRIVTLGNLNTLGFDASVEIIARGLPPRGGGCVKLTIHPVTSGNELKTCNWVSEGLITSVQGIVWSAYSMKMGDDAKRALIAAKQALTEAGCPSVKLERDHFTMKDARRSSQRDSQILPSRGYGVTLVARSNTKAMISADICIAPETGDEMQPEDAGKLVAQRLLTEIALGGCVDRGNQPLVLTAMTLGPPDYANLRTGPITDRAASQLRLLRDVLGVQFGIQSDEEMRASRALKRAKEAMEAVAEDMNAHDVMIDTQTMVGEAAVGRQTFVLTCMGRALQGAKHNS